MSLVLDASLALSWYFEDERTPAADAVLDLVVNTGAVVPSIWRVETANGLQMALWRQSFEKFRQSPGNRPCACSVVGRVLAINPAARYAITLSLPASPPPWPELR